MLASAKTKLKKNSSMYNTSNNTLSYIPISFFRCELFFMTLSDSMKSDMLGIWIEWRRGCREEFQNAQSILSLTWIFFILFRIFKQHISCYFSVDFRYSFEKIKYRYYYIDKCTCLYWMVIFAGSLTRIFIFYIPGCTVVNTPEAGTRAGTLDLSIFEWASIE